MKHRLFALVALLGLVVSLTIPPIALAAYSPSAGEVSGQRMMALKIIQGKSAVDPLALRDEITRAELVTIIVRAFGKEEDAQLLRTSRVFADTKDHWAAGYIAMAVVLVEKAGGDPVGMADGLFHPDEKLTPAQAVAFLMKFLGLRADPEMAWPHNFLSPAVSRGLISAEDRVLISPMLNENATRGLVFYLFDRAFFTYELPNGKTFYTTYVDAEAPTITLDPPGDATLSGWVTVSGQVQGAVSVRVADQTLTPQGNWFSTQVYLPDLLSSEIPVEATDLAGNVARTSVQVSRAAGIPARITIDDIVMPAGSTAKVQATTLDARGNVLENVALVGESPMGTYQDGEFTAGLTTGVGTLTLRAGVVSATAKVTITPAGGLEISGAAIQEYGRDSATVTWTTNESATSEVTIFGNIFGTTDLTTTHRVTVYGLAAGRMYMAEIRSEAGPAVDTDTITVQLPADLDISALHQSEATPDSVTITWVTNIPADSWVTVNGQRYGSDQQVTSHTVTVNGLQPGTTYTSEVTSSAVFGSATGTVSFTTTGAALSITDARASSVTENSAVILWETNLPATSYVTVNGQRYGRNDRMFSHSVEVTGLQPGQAYEAQVESSNGSQPVQTSVTFTTTSRQLAITWGPELAGYSSTNATISWATNEPSSSWVTVNGHRYGSDQPVTSHNVAVNDLQPGSTYTVDVESSSDAFGVATGTASFTTMGSLDNTPPHLWIEVEKMQLESSGSVPIYWAGNDSESGIDHYEVTWWNVTTKERGYVVRSTTSTSATFTETVPGCFYLFEVTAYDKAGNKATAGIGVQIR